MTRLLEWPPAVWTGKLSYGLYLWHYPIFLILTKNVGQLSFRYLLPLELATTFAAASLSYYLLELPIVREKARFTPKRA